MLKNALLAYDDGKRYRAARDPSKGKGKGKDKDGAPAGGRSNNLVEKKIRDMVTCFES